MEEKKKKLLLSVAVIAIIVGVILGGVCAFNKSPNLANSEFRIILTDSMAGEPQQQYDIKTIPVNSLVAIHKLGKEDLAGIKVGDVISFYSHEYNLPVHHRVIEVHYGEGYFITKGDNAHFTETVQFKDVNGIVVNVSHTAGEVLHFIKEHIVAIIVAILLILIVVEAATRIYRIYKE